MANSAPTSIPMKLLFEGPKSSVGNTKLTMPMADVKTPARKRNPMYMS